VVPDLVATAKGIAGGMPLAAVTGRAELMGHVHPGGLGGTYSGNPVACAAALAAMQTMADLDLRGAARRTGAVISDRLQALQKDHPAIGDVRGRGAMQAIEFVDPGSTTATPAVASGVAAKCHSAGVVVLTCGTWSNVIRLLPPLTIEDGLLEEGLDVLSDAIASTV
jgi:4-aminobutyrate aminotransferase/(S)-3-amino-2-methylpropionate transaminase